MFITHYEGGRTYQLLEDYVFIDLWDEEEGHEYHKEKDRSSLNAMMMFI
jgi:hypothetical protein